MAHVDSFNDLKELGIECDSNDSLTDIFNKASNYLPTILSKIDNKTLLTLYGYYKQGSEGPCNIPKPSWFDLRAKSKWETWKNLGDMPQQEAKRRYVDTLSNIDPGFKNNLNNKEPCWVSVSTLQTSSVNEADKNIVDFIKDGNKEKLINSLNGYKDINKLDDDGLALIHWAADSGSVDILQIVIDFGADVNLQDSEGQTALHYASSCGHLECIKLLLSKNAEKGILDESGMSPKDVASDETVKELLK